MKKTLKNLLLRLIIKQEIPTYSIQVAFFGYFVIFNYPYTRDPIFYFLVAAATALTILAGTSVKYYFMKPMFKYIKNDDMDDKTYSAAINVANKLPLIDAVTVTLRYSIGILIMTVLVLILYKTSLIELVPLMILGILSAVFCFPYYFFSCENECDKFLEIINHETNGKFIQKKSISITVKIIIFFFSIFLYLIFILLFITFLLKQNIIDINSIEFQVYPFLGATCLYTIIMFFFFIVNIKSKISSLNKLMENVGQGEGDLTTRLKIKSFDEISIISNNYNMFVNKLEKLIMSLKTASSQSKMIIENLSKSSEVVNTTSKDFSKTIDSINNKTELLNQRIENTHRQITVINESTDELDG